jgi:flagellar hook-length control protein FliK
MELVASLPPDLAALADPTARAAASPLRPTDQDDPSEAAAAPFDLLLALLTTQLPAGQSLPVTGNALPAATADPSPDAAAPAAATAKPVTSPTLASTTAADLFARLKLGAAAPATPTAAAPNSAATAPAADVAPSAGLPLSALDSPSAAAAGAEKPAVAAPGASADSAPRPAMAAALEAALPPTTARDPTPKPRGSQARSTEPAAAIPTAGVAATDLHADDASATTALGSVADFTDAAARPVRRETAVEAFALPAATPSADAAAPATSATPVLGPSHAATAATTVADASAAAAQGGAIDTRADNWHEALASRVQVLVDQHVGEAHIKLNPPELGAVDIKISFVEDKTFVQLTAGTSAARDELTQSLPRLRELLSAGGLSLGGASVHGGGGGQAGYDAAPRMAVPSTYSPFAAADDSIEPMRIAPRAVGRIDLFA